MSTTRDITRTTKEAPKHIGVNLARIDEWRLRLVDAAGKLTYRQIADRTGGGGARRLSHTTVRSVMVGDTTSVQIDTLAAICDAIGVDMVQIIGGPSSVQAELPGGTKMLGTPKVQLVPIVNLPLAHEWKKLTTEIDPNDDVVFLSGGAGDVRAARVTDNSMAPAYEKGDVVLFEQRTPENGDVVLVEPEGQGHTMLRIWRGHKDPTKVKLEAANEDYGSVTMTTSRAKVVGVVTGLHRHLT